MLEDGQTKQEATEQGEQEVRLVMALVRATKRMGHAVRQLVEFSTYGERQVRHALALEQDRQFAKQGAQIDPEG